MSIFRVLPALALLLLLTAGIEKCAAQDPDPVDIGFMLRGVGTQYSVSGESRVGGNVGFDSTVHLTGNWGLLGSANLNQLEDGEQIGGSFGVVKLSDYSGMDFDLWSFSLLFDHFTDTRVNTSTGSLYLSQLRLQTGYAISRDMEIGTVLSTPTNKEKDVEFFLTAFPGSLPLPGVLKMSNSGKVYLAGQEGPVQWSANVGYRDSPGTWIFGATYRAKLSEKLAGFAGASYEENPGNFSSFVGMEINISPNRRGSRSRNQVYSTPVVRAQSPGPGSSVRLASLTVDESEGDKGKPSQINPLDRKRIKPLNGGQSGTSAETVDGQDVPLFNDGQPGTFAPGTDPNQIVDQNRLQDLQNRELPLGRRFNAAYFDRLGKLEFTLWPNISYSSVGTDGLFGDQQKFQGPFSGYGLRDKDGNPLRNDLNPFPN